MADIMTRLKLYALLVVFDLFGIPVTTWLRFLPELVCLTLVIMVVIPLLEMMKGFSIRDVPDL